MSDNCENSSFAIYILTFIVMFMFMLYIIQSICNSSKVPTYTRYSGCRGLMNASHRSIMNIGNLENLIKIYNE